MRTLLLLFGAVVALSFSEAIQLRSEEKERETYPYALDKCCNFSFRLYKNVARKFKGNLALAPFSAFDSLSLLSYGAGGNTAKEIREVLNVPAEWNKELSNYESLAKSLTEPKDQPLKFVQVLYIPDKIEVTRSFKELSSGSFITKQKCLNFEKPEQAISEVNKYFEGELSQQEIPLGPEINLPPDMFIRSSFYFKGEFLYPFDQRYTENRPFCKNRDEKELVPTMFVRGKFRGIVIPPRNDYLDSFKVIEIPYKNREYSMLIYYPLNSYNLVELEQRLDTLDIRPIFNSRLEDIELYLPKFKIQSEQRLKLTLNEMGMIDAFGKRANFTGISRKPLHLDELYMSAYFSVNEFGSTGDASNLMDKSSYTNLARPLSRPLEIEVNRPFMFTVIKKRGSDFLCLFQGRVYNPDMQFSFFN